MQFRRNGLAPFTNRCLFSFGSYGNHETSNDRPLVIPLAPTVKNVILKDFIYSTPSDGLSRLHLSPDTKESVDTAVNDFHSVKTVVYLRGKTSITETEEPIRLQRRSFFSLQKRAQTIRPHALTSAPKDDHQLGKRSPMKDGLAVILTDVIVLSIVLFAALALILLTYYRRKIRRRQENDALPITHPAAEVNLDASQSMNIEPEADEGIPPEIPDKDHAAVSSTRSGSVDSSPLLPPTSTSTPKISSFPQSHHPSQSYQGVSSRNSQNTIRPCGNLPVSPTDTDARRSIMRNPSSSSNKTDFGYISSISAFTRFSTRSFSEIALSDTRSAVLSRNASIKSSATQLSRTFSKSSISTVHTARPGSTIPDIPAFPISFHGPQSPHRSERLGMSYLYTPEHPVQHQRPSHESLSTDSSRLLYQTGMHSPVTR